MKQSFWEIVDKATILKIKQERGLPVSEQLAEYMEEAKNCPEELFNELYEVNNKMWDMENLISMLFNGGSWYNAGQAYYELRQLTHKRTEVKNKIAAKFDKYQEEKDYNEHLRINEH